MVGPGGYWSAPGPSGAGAPACPQGCREGGQRLRVQAIRRAGPGRSVGVRRAAACGWRGRSEASGGLMRGRRRRRLHQGLLSDSSSSVHGWRGPGVRFTGDRENLPSGMACGVDRATGQEAGVVEDVERAAMGGDRRRRRVGEWRAGRWWYGTRGTRAGGGRKFSGGSLWLHTGVRTLGRCVAQRPALAPVMCCDCREP